MSVSISQHLVAVGIRPTRMNFKISKLFVIASAKAIDIFKLGNSLFPVSPRFNNNVYVL